MPNKTTNYQLNQWEPEDDFLRTDFNEDNAKIEAALTALTAGQVKVVAGSYTGTNSADGREIEVGFQPDAVVLFYNRGFTYNSGYTYGGLFLPGAPLITGNGSVAAEVTDTGFKVYYNSNQQQYTDQYGSTYHYLALKW